MIDLKEKRTILVTGGAGFIGSHLCEKLVSLGHMVISLDDYSTGSEKNHVAEPQYRRGHTTEIEKRIPETVDLVFHLGEYSRTSQSFKDLPRVWHSNMDGTFAVLEYCRLRKVPIVYAGSSTKFGDDNTGYLQSPYAWTKTHNTGLLARYGEWFSLPYVITYFYNVYGGRESSDPEYGTLIAIYKKLYQEGARTIPVVKPGTQERNFTHVDDIVEGLIRAAEKGSGDGYCFGSPEVFTIEAVAKMFGNEIKYLPYRPGDRMRASIDLSKTEKKLGWKATRHLADYIAEIKAHA
ncbi:MAG: NAD-dependent epimerase/dehydratase family protein [Candidatus Zambryskibacteria bacterium]|nr:NAD-dependent epimerase/dehydratase family protein [Candidatus Zambryskibacteria bacterium]